MVAIKFGTVIEILLFTRIVSSFSVKYLFTVKQFSLEVCYHKAIAMPFLKIVLSFQRTVTIRPTRVDSAQKSKVEKLKILP